MVQISHSFSASPSCRPPVYIGQQRELGEAVYMYTMRVLKLMFLLAQILPPVPRHGHNYRSPAGNPLPHPQDHS
jgi:hypothetical protein